MGWWTVDGCADELGDGSADILESKLEEFVARTRTVSLQYFLDSAAAALREVGSLVVSDPVGLETMRLRARFAPPAPELLSGEPTDMELQATLSSALVRITEEYEAGLGRKPRVTEVLGTFGFSLSSPERYFSESKGLRLLGIVTDPERQPLREKEPPARADTTGWWAVDGSADELGDGPVGVLASQLENHNCGITKPTLQHYLDSAAAALRDTGPLVVSDPESVENIRLRACFAPPLPDQVSDVAPSDTGLTDTLGSALFRIMDEYEAGLGRLPRLTEVLGTLALPIRKDAEHFLSGAEGIELRGFVAERG